MSLLLLFATSVLDEGTRQSTDPIRLTLKAWRGATYRKTLTVREGSDADSPVRDLSGYSAHLDIIDQGSGRLVTSLSTANGGIALGGPLGTVTIHMSAADTAAVLWDPALYELFLVGLDVELAFRGSFFIQGE